MGKLTFKGGIHPYEGKELAKNHPIEKYLPKGDMAYLMSQHIGAPSVPCVKKGDQVLAGQKIADAGGFVSVPLHASVSGTVKGIEKRLNATGAMIDAIIVENDQQYQEVEFTPAKLEDLTKEEILNRIKEGGVVGMGGAGFPTHVKLAPKDPSKIEYVLVNGAECEPSKTEGGLPPGVKSSVGSNKRQMPVNESSKVFKDTAYFPFAGSFKIALLPRKPSNTTKWLKFQ